MRRSWFDELGASECTAQRVEALWRHSPEARRRMGNVLVDLAISDPRSLSERQRNELCYALITLNLDFPDAERVALTNTARIAAAESGWAGGTRTDAGRLVRDWLPDFRDEVMAGFDAAAAVSNENAEGVA